MRRTTFVAASMILLSGAAYAQQTPNTPTGSGSNNDLATKRTDPNTAKPYQPNNPNPDTRKSPTGSTTGIGSSNGGRPEQTPK